jgi:SusD family.
MDLIYKYRTRLIVGTWMLALCACRKFVTLNDPQGQLTSGRVFNDKGSATAAVLGLYTNYIDYTFPVMCKTGGLASDELFTTNPELTPYLSNEILPSIALPGDTWAQEFAHIRECNLAINGLENATSLDIDIKNQLLGEAKFLRAFGFFNLLNFYGGVPLTLSINDIENASLPRASEQDVWKQIFKDLVEAKELVAVEYPSAERARINKSAVAAFLARAYLYHNEWENAEDEATEVIEQNSYSLEDLSRVFTPQSKETILQIYIQQGINPLVFDYLPPAPGFAPAVYLRNDFKAAFEPGDLRKDNWVGTDGSLSFVHKYKNNDYTSTEYLLLFRLAETYLIRAEARAQRDHITGLNSAESDINTVRSRSNLKNITITDKKAALIAIEQERKVELFGEYPHRWFDLKRMKGLTSLSQTRADEVVAALKGATWQPTDKLFPIKSEDIRLNPQLKQNDGYPNQ